MGGKGSGGYRAKGTPNAQARSRELRNEDIDPGLNARVMALGRELMEFEPVDFTDESAIKDRFMEYLNLCERLSLRPMVASMASSMGLTRAEFVGIATGNPRYDRWRGGLLTPSGRCLFQKIYDFLNVAWENYLVEENGNPVKWLFLGKNYFGMKDQTERIDVRVDATPKLPDAQVVAQKYAAMVGKETPQLEQAEVLDVEDA